MRGDEDVAREEGFEVYEGECCGGCVEDLPFVSAWGCVLEGLVVVAMVEVVPGRLR